MRKLIFIITASVVILIPHSANAQLDPRCWTEKACADARVKQANGDRAAAKEGFVPTSEAKSACGQADAAGNEYGFCLPVGKTVTQIAFGGKKEFLHLGDFIQYGYRYGVMVAGILGVLVIFAAGIEWLTSGGNAERISSAHKRIAGALMGVLIAAMSYVILDAINPYLTRLRLPQIWMLNQQSDVPILCADLLPGTKIALAKNQNEKQSQTELSSRYGKAVSEKKFFVQDVTKKDTRANCENEYFTEKGGLQTCRGAYCEPSGGEMRVCSPTPEDPFLFSCRPGSITGTVYNANVSLEALMSDASYGILGEQWEFPWTDEGENELHGVCVNGTKFEYPTETFTLNNEQKKTQMYVIKLADKDIDKIVKNQCGSLEDFKGFAVKFEMSEDWDDTDEDHFIGSSGDEDLGDADRFTLQTRKSMSREKFISLKQLKEGYYLNVNAGKIPDYD